jgi:predicted membrane protein
MASNPNKRYILGGVLVLIGALLVLENLRIFDNIFPYYLFDWYSIPLLIGIVLITTRDKIGFGIALTIFGSIFLLEEMSHYYRWRFDFWDVFDFGPIIFIAVGLSLILRKGRDRNGSWNEKKNLDGSDSDYVDEMAFFGGSERIITSREFKGGKLTSIFGGTDLNLMNADLATGTNVLDVFVLFGGTDIVVSSDMNVRIQVTSIFGAFSDERKVLNDNPDNDDKELVIKGLVLFGGGDVK